MIQSTLSLRTGHGSAPAHPHTDYHMSKNMDSFQILLCVPIATVRKWSKNYAYTIAISNGCICHSYVILVLVVMS